MVIVPMGRVSGETGILESGSGQKITNSRRIGMSEMIKSEGISRRKTLSLLGLAAVFGLVASTRVLAVSDAEAQTIGMQRRHARRTRRVARRYWRRHY
jgi:hypothetical protein